MEVVAQRSTTSSVDRVLDDPSSFTFRCRIVNFSKLPVDKLCSEVFIAGGCKWRLLIFPKGNNKNNLSIYLDVADSASLPNGWRRNAKFSLAVVNVMNSRFTITKAEQRLFDANKSVWGFNSIIPLTKLHDPAFMYLMNDNLIVEAKVIVSSVVHHSTCGFSGVELKLQERVTEAPDLPQEETVDFKIRVGPETKPQNQAEGILRTASSTSDQELLASFPSPERSSVDTALSSEHLQSSLNEQIKSRSFLTELSSGSRTWSSSLSGEISVSPEAAAPDFLQKQKETLECFFNMSVEAIQAANAFDNIERSTLKLIQQINNLNEKMILEDFFSHLAECRENICNAETPQARKISLSARTADIGARLVQRRKEQSSLKAELSRLSEEEEKLGAEIQLLITQKKELLARKNSLEIQLEKTSEETSEDLEEWQSLEKEIKKANADWVGAKERLEQVNVHWKLLKENLGLGRA